MPVVDSASFRNGVVVPLVSNVENDSSDGYLSNEMAVSILRKDMSPEKITNVRQSDGYTFDYNRCIQFNNRILCGYEKNKGPLLDDYTMIDIGSGCRTRGDRIECGYDNPQYYKNLRHPGVQYHGHGEENVHDKQSEHNTQYRNNHHHRVHHHHVIKHHGIQGRQAPTRTSTITETTTPSVTLNVMKTDNLENKLLKPASSKFVMKAEDTSIGSIKTRAKIEVPSTNNTTESSTTNTAESSTTTTTTRTMTTTAKVILIDRKSRVASRSTGNTPKSTTNRATTLTAKITTPLPKNSESNDISDGETTMLRLKPIIKQKRRRSIKLLSTLPKLVRKSKPDHTVVPRISNVGKTRVNGTALRMETDSAEKKVKTACVEQNDRVVCYDFKT